MFFYEWLVPVFLLIAAGVAMLYLAVRRRVGCGIRTDGRTLLDKPAENEPSQTLTH